MESLNIKNIIPVSSKEKIFLPWFAFRIVRQIRSNCFLKRFSIKALAFWALDKECMIWFY